MGVIFHETVPLSTYHSYFYVNVSIWTSEHILIRSVYAKLSGLRTKLAELDSSWEWLMRLTWSTCYFPIPPFREGANEPWVCNLLHTFLKSGCSFKCMGLYGLIVYCVVGLGAWKHALWYKYECICLKEKDVEDRVAIYIEVYWRLTLWGGYRI
jgi:hypothetical protein